MPARSVAKWVKLGVMGAAGGLAVIAMAPHAIGQVSGGAQLGGPEGEAQAQAAAPAAGGDAAKFAKGKELFNTWACSTCHSLKDADASGHVGPAFDGNPSLTEAFIVDRVTNGQGPMPAFGGQMNEEEIAAVAAYIKHVAIPPAK